MGDIPITPEVQALLRLCLVPIAPPPAPPPPVNRRGARAAVFAVLAQQPTATLATLARLTGYAHTTVCHWRCVWRLSAPIPA